MYDLANHFKARIINIRIFILVQYVGYTVQTQIDDMAYLRILPFSCEQKNTPESLLPTEKV